MTDDTATAVAIAGLTERVSGLTSTINRLEGIITAQSASIANFQVLQRDLQILEEQNKTTLAAIEAQALLTSAHSKVIERHSTVSRICAVAVMACLGLVGWGYNQIKKFEDADNELDRRVLIMEYEAKGLNAVKDRLGGVDAD